MNNKVYLILKKLLEGNNLHMNLIKLILIKMFINYKINKK